MLHDDVNVSICVAIDADKIAAITIYISCTYSRTCTCLHSVVDYHVTRSGDIIVEFHRAGRFKDYINNYMFMHWNCMFVTMQTATVIALLFVLL